MPLTETEAHARTAVPRVIRPDEVRKGQVMAMCFDTVTNGPEWYLDEPGYPASIDSVVTAADTIILLADAPEGADEGDDFPCCRILQTGICEDIG